MRQNDFLQQPPTPQRTFDFEHELEEKLREAGRQVAEQTYNAAKGEPAESLPARVRIAGGPGCSQPSLSRFLGDVQESLRGVVMPAFA
jgi:hypothetical protein